MYSVTKEWNPNQKKLSQLLAKQETFDQAIQLCLQMHNSVHDLKKEISPTVYQSLLEGLTPAIMKYRPNNSFSSIAWSIWHITRIEDAVSNILIADSEQILNKEWLEKININITDTGNAFTENDVDIFDEMINTKELLKYRKAVGENTQKILQKLKVTERKRKPSKEQLDRIIQEKVLLQEKDSIWLLDFWANKTVSGLLTMPITRHQIVHINDCLKLKDKYKRKYV